jgi:CheY-like chemotaxis protein
VSPPQEKPAALRVAALLVIERDPELRRLLAEVLGDAGYAATCVDSNDAALAALPGLGRPCLLLTDIADRSWDDAEWAFLRRVKAEYGAGVTLAAVSNSFARSLHRPAEIAAALPKPFDLHALLAMLEAFYIEPAPPAGG